MSDEVKTRRQLLEEAWDATEEKDDNESSEVFASAGEEQAEVTQEKPDGEEVRPSEEQSGVQKADTSGEKKEQKVDKAVQQELKAAKKIESGKEQKPQQEQLDPTDKAPGSWKPATRELWAQLPKAVRDEVRQRERHIEQTLTQTATMRKFATDFAQMVQPYSHLIRAQNSTPLQAVHNLMSTAAGLMQGNPQQKAEMVAQIMGNYGVDVQLLDQVLAKAYNPQTAQFNAQQNSAPPAWAQPIFAWMNKAEQTQQQYEAQQRQIADQEIEQMSSQPFFDDLRDDIADIMEIAAKRGKIISLQDAYKKAVELDPEISKLVKKTPVQSAPQNDVSRAASTLARARKAAKTIHGAPRGEGGKSDKPKTRREQLSEAWDEQSSN